MYRLFASSLLADSTKLQEYQKYMCAFLKKLFRRLRFRKTSILGSTSPVIDFPGKVAMKRTSVESPRAVSDTKNGIKSDLSQAGVIATSLIILSSEEKPAKPHHNFVLFLFTEEIKLALLWVKVARSAYTAGDVKNGNEAKTRALVAYLKAKNLLTQIESDKTIESLLPELEALWLALDRLAVLALHASKPQLKGSIRLTR
jgi:hypothetical protein